MQINVAILRPQPLLCVPSAPVKNVSINYLFLNKGGFYFQIGLYIFLDDFSHCTHPVTKM